MVPFCWALLGTALFIALTSGASLSHARNDNSNISFKSLEKPNLLRSKRSGRGYARGQTQSQYLNFGKPEQDGKAEAEANESGSRSTVSGTHGMGQAQSQFSFGDCSDCASTQIYEYPSGPPDPLTYPSGTTGADRYHYAKPGPTTGTPGGGTGQVQPGQLDVGYRPRQEPSGPRIPSHPDQLSPGGQLPSQGQPGQQPGLPNIPISQTRGDQKSTYIPGHGAPVGPQVGSQSGLPNIPIGQTRGDQQNTYMPGHGAPVGPQVGSQSGRFDGTGTTTGDQNIQRGPQNQFIPIGSAQLQPNAGGQQTSNFGGSREIRPRPENQLPAGGKQGIYSPGQGIYSSPPNTILQQPNIAVGSRPLDSNTGGLGTPPISGTIPSGTVQQPQLLQKPPGISNGYYQTLPQGTIDGSPQDSSSSRGPKISVGGGGIMGPQSGGQGGMRTQPNSGTYIPSSGPTPEMPAGGIYTRPGYHPGSSGIKQGYVSPHINPQAAVFSPSYGRGQQSQVPVSAQRPDIGPHYVQYPGNSQVALIPGTENKEMFMPGVIVPQARPSLSPDAVKQTLYQSGRENFKEGFYNNGVQNGRYGPNRDTSNKIESFPQDTFNQKTVPEADTFYGSTRETGTGQSSHPGPQSFATGIKQNIPGTVNQRVEPQNAVTYLQRGTSYIPGTALRGPEIELDAQGQPGGSGGFQRGGIYTGSGVQPGLPVYGGPSGPVGPSAAYGSERIFPSYNYSPGTNGQGDGIPQPTAQQRVYGPGGTFQQGPYSPSYGGQHVIPPALSQNTQVIDFSKRPIVYTSGTDTQQKQTGAQEHAGAQQNPLGGRTYGQAPAHVDFGTGTDFEQGVYSQNRGHTDQRPETFYPNAGSPRGEIPGAGNVYGTGTQQGVYDRTGVQTGGTPMGNSQTYLPGRRGAENGQHYIPGGGERQGNTYSPSSTGMPDSGGQSRGLSGNQGIPFYPPQTSDISPAYSGGYRPGSFYGPGTAVYGQGLQPGNVLSEPRGGLQPEQMIGPDTTGTNVLYPGAMQNGYTGSLGGGGVGGGSTTGLSVHPSNLIGTSGLDGSVGADDAFSQAESSISDGQASATAQGKKNGGAAKTQVSGTYSSTGTFSASAMTSDSDRSANAQVSGSSEGAMSQSQGHGGAAQSQAQVQVNAKNGGTKASSQSGGIIHQSQSEVQANDKGGLADAQSSGPGQTSSQAQIGFRPRQDGSIVAPSASGGQASAQSGAHSGQSQAQIQGQSKFGVSYHGAAQSASGTKEQVANYREQNRDLFHSISQFGSADAVTDRVDTVYNGPSLTSESELPLPDLQLKTSKSSKETSNKLDDDEASLVDEDDEEDPYEEYDDEDDYYSDKTIKMDEHLKTSTHSASSPAASTNKEEPYSTHRTHTQTSPTQTQQIAVANPNDKYSFVQNQNGHIQRYPSQSSASTTEIVPNGFRGTVNIEKKFHTKALETSETDSKETTDNEKLSKKIRTPDSYVTVTKSVTGSMDNSKNPPQENKNFQSTYYTKSSTCGYFTFTCNIVYGANGRSKICRPKAPTNGKC